MLTSADTSADTPAVTAAVTSARLEGDVYANGVGERLGLLALSCEGLQHCRLADSWSPYDQSSVGANAAFELVVLQQRCLPEQHGHHRGGRRGGSLRGSLRSSIAESLGPGGLHRCRLSGGERQRAFSQWRCWCETHAGSVSFGDRTADAAACCYRHKETFG